MPMDEVLSGEAIRVALGDFIVRNFLFGDSSRRPDDRASLVESGVIDSTGVLELIEFVEDSFGVHVEESETTPQNFDTIAGIVSFVRRKSGGRVE